MDKPKVNTEIVNIYKKILSSMLLDSTKWINGHELISKIDDSNNLYFHITTVNDKYKVCIRKKESYSSIEIFSFVLRIFLDRKIINRIHNCKKMIMYNEEIKDIQKIENILINELGDNTKRLIKISKLKKKCK